MTQGAVDGADNAFPSWSPDGTKIVFMSDRIGRQFDLFVMNPDGSEVVQVSREPSESTKEQQLFPAWSPLPGLVTPSAIRALSWGQVKVGGW